MSKSNLGGILVLAVAAVFAALPAAAADAGRLQKAEPLRAEPFRDASTLSTLAAGDRVDILRRRGGWFQVKSAKGNGWVRMLSVRRGEAGKASGESEAAGLLGLASGRAGTGTVVATTGIRGLNEEQLKAAKYSASELRLSDSFVQSPADARKFAAKGKLNPRPMDYLPAPTE
jgi:hypothetical protein